VEVLHDGFLRVIRAANGHEVIEATDSVVILIYVANWDCVAFVKQFRIAAKNSDYNPTGEVLELPAGRFDEEGLTIESLARKEALEEVGIDLTNYEIHKIYPDPLTVCAGILTERTWLLYAEVLSFDVDKDDRVYGVDGEQIERVFLPVNYLREDFAPQAMSDAAAINWFLRIKRKEE